MRDKFDLIRQAGRGAAKRPPIARLQQAAQPTQLGTNNQRDPHPGELTSCFAKRNYPSAAPAAT
jgi:hypothetical protein